ncbi:hypothetical protein [Desulfoferrobacter suflitae]|uniref:hypothetical protein n=1 Tax=Desulfoferrobacter suflitae TaxID=2865782 RepID=UPI002164C079|nr:hypothetical protein [Desulfoferrobacter suflitae]MCK8604193.1 hypothetical protein [Desulfoferrobacter suflitae]MDD3815863.1 hypothetical protein [Desulfocapsaceae bacterium]
MKKKLPLIVILLILGIGLLHVVSAPAGDHGFSYPEGLHCFSPCHAFIHTDIEPYGFFGSFLIGWLLQKKTDPHLDNYFLALFKPPRCSP